MNNLNNEIKNPNGAVELDDDMLDGVAGGLVQLCNPSSSKLGGSKGDLTYFKDGTLCTKCSSKTMIITKVYSFPDRFDVACNACGNAMGSKVPSADIYTK